MKISGIIAEYNPFHNGHLYHIQKTKEAGATHIAVVLGGSFTQRGDVAFLSKAARTEAAVRAGADLVLELPCLWSMSTAANFALGGVSVLAGLGVVDELSFGSENGDAGELARAAAAAADPAIQSELSGALAGGATFAAARQKAVARHYGAPTAALLRQPNNTLAIEYITAASRLNAGLDFFTVARTGAAHDSDELHAFSSASAIRKAFVRGGSFYGALPSFSEEILRREATLGRTAQLSSLENAILCKLKLTPRSMFSALPDLSEGIENRLYDAVRTARSLEELFMTVKTKRYTLARVRRLVLCAFLDFDNALWMQPVPYLRVLGLGTGGAEILRKAKKAAGVPVIMKAKDALALGGAAEKAMRRELAATDMFNMATTARCCGNNEFISNIYKERPVPSEPAE